MGKFKSRRKRHYKKLYIIIIFFIIMFFIYKNNSMLINNKTFLSYLINDNLNLHDKDINDIEFIMKYALNLEYKESEIKPVVNIKKEEVKSPLVYIYNTHQKEEYKRSFLDTYNIPTTVLVASKILKEYLDNNGIYTLVEETDLISTRNALGLKYGKSYMVSRTALENAYENNKSLKYFIDIHRDAGSHDKTTIYINNTNYAKFLFVVGLDNPSYENNLVLATNLSDRLNMKINGISRGITKKSGLKVNGVYNQDFNKNTMLIEVGGESNNIEEVNNSLYILASTLKEYIMENENGI